MALAFLRILAQTSPVESQSAGMQALIVTAVSTLVAAIVSGGITLRIARRTSSIESRRVTIEEFRTHMTFYEQQIDELKGALDRERSLREKQLAEAREQLRLSNERENAMRAQIVNLTYTVETLRFELSEATRGGTPDAPFSEG